MKTRPLGRSGVEVSELCLGTMTWGTQNSVAQAHDQIDRALAAGVNFMDTAEMYPVNPVSEETIGRTERIIGLWVEGQMRRHEAIIATKHSGAGLQYVREGAPITPDSIPRTLEGSLRRLKTDYIDLYQFHWPNRGSYMFRQNWTYDPTGWDAKSEIQMMEDCIGALQVAVEQGKIRAFGLSNESAWGTMQWLKAGETAGGPRVAAIQNEYSLLCRLFDTDMAELTHHENIPLLAFSPLATGLLSGKYQQGAIPDGSRMALTPGLGGRKTDRAFPAVDAYLEIARKHGLDPSQMAIAWCLTRPFPCIPIFGATTPEQLDLALGSAEIELSEEVLADIDAAHRAHPMPY